MSKDQQDTERPQRSQHREDQQGHINQMTAHVTEPMFGQVDPHGVVDGVRDPGGHADDEQDAGELCVQVRVQDRPGVTDEEQHGQAS